MPIRESKYIWFNGEMVPWEKATVHVMTHALHYGSSVFEGSAPMKRPRALRFSACANTSAVSSIRAGSTGWIRRSRRIRCSKPAV